MWHRLVRCSFDQGVDAKAEGDDGQGPHHAKPGHYQQRSFDRDRGKNAEPGGHVQARQQHILGRKWIVIVAELL